MPGLSWMASASVHTGKVNQLLLISECRICWLLLGILKKNIDITIWKLIAYPWKLSQLVTKNFEITIPGFLEENQYCLSKNPIFFREPDRSNLLVEMTAHGWHPNGKGLASEMQKCKIGHGVSGSKRFPFRCQPCASWNPGIVISILINYWLTLVN